MVKLEEVQDEELDQAQPGPIADSEDDADYVDTGNTHKQKKSLAQPLNPAYNTIIRHGPC